MEYEAKPMSDCATCASRFLIFNFKGATLIHVHTAVLHINESISHTVIPKCSVLSDLVQI